MKFTQFSGKNKILLTGAAGFIGSHLARRLLTVGCRVTAIDNFNDFYPRHVKEENISGIRNNVAFRLLELDIASRDFIEVLLKKTKDEQFDSIIHLAARAGVRPSIEDPVGYQESNVKGTQNMLEFARINDISQFVFASSSSVYGVNPNVPWREDDHVLQPISPYASTKVSGELLGHVYSHLYGIRFIALRFFTVYGPNQRPDLAIHKFIKMITKNEPIQMFGDGKTKRDYTYIDDIVEGIIAAMGYYESMYEIVNLGNNVPVYLDELISKIERVLGKKAIIEKAPMQPGDVPETWANIDKAKKLLGYKPRTDLDTGLEAFASWFRQSNKKVSF